jgi:hypothetical protein
MRPTWYTAQVTSSFYVVTLIIDPAPLIVPHCNDWPIISPPCPMVSSMNLRPCLSVATLLLSSSMSRLFTEWMNWMNERDKIKGMLIWVKHVTFLNEESLGFKNKSSLHIEYGH